MPSKAAILFQKILLKIKIQYIVFIQINSIIFYKKRHIYVMNVAITGEIYFLRLFIDKLKYNSRSKYLIMRFST